MPSETLSAEKCSATLSAGPGHQSTFRCERVLPHRIHRDCNGREWVGEKGFTGFFDEAVEVPESEYLAELAENERLQAPVLAAEVAEAVDDLERIIYTMGRDGTSLGLDHDAGIRRDIITRAFTMLSEERDRYKAFGEEFIWGEDNPDKYESEMTSQAALIATLEAESAERGRLMTRLWKAAEECRRGSDDYDALTAAIEAARATVTTGEEAL